MQGPCKPLISRFGLVSRPRATVLDRRISNGSMNMRSAALVPVLLLAAALSADGATTPLVADTASALMAITEDAPMQFFTFTPASNETITFNPKPSTPNPEP